MFKYKLYFIIVSITLDTSVLFFEDPLWEELTQLRKEGNVDLFIELDSIMEKQNYENIKKKIEDLRKIGANTIHEGYAYKIPERKKLNDVLPWTMKEYQKIYDKVRVIHSPEYENLSTLTEIKKGNKIVNKHIDWDIMTLHILRGRDYFLTNDKWGFINGGRKEKFEKKFKIKVRVLDECFIKELKSL